MGENIDQKAELELLVTDIQERWNHVENFEAVKNMISFSMDFVICGPPGSGKSQFLADLASITDVEPKYVNCLEHNSKSKVIHRISDIFSTEIGLDNIRAPTLDKIISAVSNDKGKNSIMLESYREGKTAFCVVIENFNQFLSNKDGPQEALLLYEKLKIFKHHVDLPFSFVFISSCHCDIPIPKIMIPYPNDEMLVKYINNTLIAWTHKFQNKSRIGLDPKIINAMITHFSSRIMQVFNVVTKEFKLFEAIVMKLWSIKIKSFIQTYKKYEEALNCYGLDATRILLGLDRICYEDKRVQNNFTKKIAMQNSNGSFDFVEKKHIHIPEDKKIYLITGEPIENPFEYDIRRQYMEYKFRAERKQARKNNLTEIARLEEEKIQKKIVWSNLKTKKEIFDQKMSEIKTGTKKDKLKVMKEKEYEIFTDEQEKKYLKLSKEIKDVNLKVKKLFKDDSVRVSKYNENHQSGQLFKFKVEDERKMKEYYKTKIRHLSWKDTEPFKHMLEDENMHKILPAPYTTQWYRHVKSEQMRVSIEQFQKMFYQSMSDNFELVMNKKDIEELEKYENNEDEYQRLKRHFINRTIIRVFDLLRSQSFKPFKKKYMKLFREYLFRDQEKFKPEVGLAPDYLCREYKSAERLFLRDPKMAFKPMIEILKAMNEQKEIIRSNVRGTSQTMAIVKEKELMNKSFDLPTLPGIILVSIYLANRNSESEDRRIFKALGEKKGRHAFKYTSKTPRTPYIERILFISQVLLAIHCDQTKKVGYSNYEKELTFQSIQFFTSFKLLEELKLIRRIHTGIDEFQRPRFDCLCEKSMIEKIAEDFGIGLQEFAI